MYNTLILCNYIYFILFLNFFCKTRLGWILGQPGLGPPMVAENLEKFSNLVSQGGMCPRCFWWFPWKTLGHALPPGNQVGMFANVTEKCSPRWVTEVATTSAHNDAITKMTHTRLWWWYRASFSNITGIWETSRHLRWEKKFQNPQKL